MRVLYFDCFSGVSGDMMLGALLDLGIDQNKFLDELNKLNLPGYDIIIEKKVIDSITVTDVNIIVEGIEDSSGDHHNHQHNHSHDHNHSHGHNHSHSHDHNHSHGHNHSHSHDHNHNHGHSHGHSDGHFHHHYHPSRNLEDIEKIIDESTLKPNVKEFGKKVFKEIARAEAKVHNKGINEIHFHEVGAVDSIVDIMGVAICIDLLGVDKIYSSPLRDGNGFIKCQHGVLPVPVPAVMEMLKGSEIPYITEDIGTELVTPTGIALIKCLCSEYGVTPPIKIEKTGYGAGKRKIGRLNALRCVLGTLMDESKRDDEIYVLETNIDDMNPEFLGYVMEMLLENGALEVFYTPVYMKKNRPGVVLTVLSPKEIEEKLSNIILRETSTLGVRKTVCKRQTLTREERTVMTKYGEVKVKISLVNGLEKVSPEYEDCKRVAKEKNIPLWKVYEEVKNAVQ
ncbi:nickel pincer cofactor biosynthesis protein LarC [Acetivibrio saccincola]|jgi:uncharacterized protein (TIGR00299 family) protein|uniref:Pyridinium-3,5-bisthiocarboxylic acid mononucleotide nickel insertion protein n=1 Tax=Acetivibrio saccincola TaxID=1677857 RepID=A0A2S8RE32_9FIRM|nr:nickel pincer cofactor biosynthesis protein LarC [Acetivibrio saccincola]NLW26709.1 nickel pincer cofactor biosynthesis protein LarC [Acetivibrio saccincola]PQQ68049.1 TIGR00299 family protein [Acetivibrio saccincola]